MSFPPAWVDARAVCGFARAPASDRYRVTRITERKGRIDVSPLVFLGVGFGALALAVGAVTWQSLTTARVDPARVLRSE